MSLTKHPQDPKSTGKQLDIDETIAFSHPAGEDILCAVHCGGVWGSWTRVRSRPIYSGRMSVPKLIGHHGFAQSASKLRLLISLVHSV